jgi:hypothetical protein
MFVSHLESDFIAERSIIRARVRFVHFHAGKSGLSHSTPVNDPTKGK